MKIYLSTLLLLFLFHSVFTQEQASFYEQTHKYAFVSAEKLMLRSNSNIKSKITATLKKGSIVEIIQSDTTTFRINKISNHWFQVRANNNVGWAFGGGLVLLTNEENKPLPEKILIQKKELVFNEWVSIKKSAVLKKISTNTCFIADYDTVALYKEIPKGLNTKKDFVCKASVFFNPIQIKTKEYGSIGYIQFMHPKYGKVWVANNSVCTIADIYSTKQQSVLLCTSYPLFEGDRNNYQLLVLNILKNKIVYGTKPFKNVGTYASARILSSTKTSSKSTILRFTSTSFSTFDGVSNYTEEHPFISTYAVLKENKITSMYEFYYEK